MYFKHSLFSYKQENIVGIDKIVNYTAGSYMIVYRNGQRIFKIPGSNQVETMLA